MVREMENIKKKKNDFIEFRTASFIRNIEQDQNRAEKGNEVYELTVSSEEPYERFWGIEILDHNSKSIRLNRLNDGAAVLIDHNSDQVGVVEKAWIEDKKLKTSLRFSQNPKGREIKKDVDDGIRKNVSIGYRIHDLKLESRRLGAA